MEVARDVLHREEAVEDPGGRLVGGEEERRADAVGRREAEGEGEGGHWCHCRRLYTPSLEIIRALNPIS